MNEKARLFFSYAHEDQDLRDQLAKHLIGLEREGLLESWHDRAITPGSPWDKAISDHLEQADIILLLISVDFLASDYCTGREMTRALERARNGEAIVIPIMLRPVEWQNSPFRHLQYLPTEGRPVTDWGKREAAFVDIARGIRRAIEDLRRQSSEKKDTTAARHPSEPDSGLRERVLDAAMPRRIGLGKPADFNVMVRLPNSLGLRRILEIDEEYLSRPEDVREKPFLMEFPVDRKGRPAPATLMLKLRSPDFDPPSEEKPLTVPPDRDSDVCTFLITPLFTGELMLNLEVYSGNDRRASKVIRIVAEQSDRAVKGRMLVSVPISTVVSNLERTGLQPQPSMASGPPMQSRDDPRKAASSPPQKRRILVPSIAAAAAVIAVSGVSLYLLPTMTRTAPLSAAMEAAVKDANAATAAPSPVVVPVRAASREPASITVQPKQQPWAVAYNTGVEHLKAGQPDEAATQFELARKSNPNESRPVTALAAVRLSKAERASGPQKEVELSRAVETAHEAIALDPKSAENFVVQGIALQQSGKLPEAEAALRKATELDASRADAWYALGSVLQQLGNDDASQAFSKAVELKPDDPNARLRLAAVLAKKDPVKAKKNVEILMYNPAANKVQLKAAKRMDAVIRAENGNVLTTNP